MRRSSADTNSSSRESPWIEKELGGEWEMVGTVGGVRDQSDVLHLTQDRDSMSRDVTQGTFQHVLDKG